MSTSSTDPGDVSSPAHGHRGVAGNGGAPRPGAGAAGADLPPPPPSTRAAEGTAHPAHSDVRPGDLTPRWRILLGAAWCLAFFAYAAIWNASVQVGIGTWWIGPRGQPTNVAVKLLPFVLCLACALYVVYNGPRVVLVSAAGAVVAALGAIPDLSRSVGLGSAELAIAAAVAIVTASSLTGRYRTAPAVAPSDRAAPSQHAPPPPSGPPATLSRRAR